MAPQSEPCAFAKASKFIAHLKTDHTKENYNHNKRKPSAIAHDIHRLFDSGYWCWSVSYSKIEWGPDQTISSNNNLWLCTNARRYSFLPHVKEPLDTTPYQYHPHKPKKNYFIYLTIPLYSLLLPCPCTLWFLQSLPCPAHADSKTMLCCLVMIASSGPQNLTCPSVCFASHTQHLDGRWQVAQPT